MTPFIQFDSVSKTYPKQIGEKASHTALKSISFTLNEGETLGLVGLNGAGKSTSIKMIMGFMRPSSGSIMVMGESPENPHIRSQIGYLPEIANFPQHLTCMDMMRFAGTTTGMSKKAIHTASEKWLNQLNIWEDRNRMLRNFSKGMQQRMSFAMALIHDPKLLILDEPMSGLDPLGRAEIVSLIQTLRAEGKSILFCSHLLDDVERLVNRLIILHRGTIAFDGDISEIRQNMGEWIVKVEGDKTVTTNSRETLKKTLEENSSSIIEVTPPKLDHFFIQTIGSNND